MASEFKANDRVCVIATGAAGRVEDPDYVYGGVLIMPDNPERPWAPLTPYLPRELELARECRWHGTVSADHFPCRAPGETAMQFTNRALGYWRDV